MVMFIPLIVLSGEVPAIMKFSQLDSLVWWSLVVVVGIFGFAIGYVTMLQIQVNKHAVTLAKGSSTRLL